jgi:hypothetical protein
MKIFVENEGYVSRSMSVPCLVNHNIFLGSFISSQSSESSDHVSEEEDESSSICGIPIQRWVDQACGYSFQQDCLPPTHLHELLSMIDYMLIHIHDYYVLSLSLICFIIKHRGNTWVRC